MEVGLVLVLLSLASLIALRRWAARIPVGRGNHCGDAEVAWRRKQ